MAELATDILTGINPVEVLNMQHDTEARYADLFTPVDKPKLPEFHNGAVDPGQNINIDKTSPDYQLADMIRLGQTVKDKYPDSFKFQPDIKLSQDVTKRYIDEDFGYKLERDNEDFYAHQQGAAKEIFKALFAKLPAYTFTKLGTGVGYLLGLIDPSNWGSDYIQKAGDNMMAKAFSELEDNLKNDWLTTFRYTVDQNKGFFERAGTDLSFWTEDFTDGAAFLASAFVPGALVSKLGLGVKVAEGLQMINGAGKAADYLAGMAKFTAKYGDRLLTTAVNTASESMFEAKGVRDKVFSDLMATGKYSEEEASHIAGQKAKNSFLWNAAALSFSNMWETNLFYKALGKGSTSKIQTKVTSLLEDYLPARTASTGGKLAHYGWQGIKGMGVEGLYEENIQLAIQRVNEGRNTYGEYLPVLSQFLGQTRDALKGNDKEASENIGMGALIGLLFGTGVSLIKGEYSKERFAEKMLAEKLNQAKNNWLNVRDIYTVGADGKLQEDKGKVAALFLTQMKTANDLSEAQSLEHPILKSLAQKEIFGTFVASHLNNDTHDLLMKQLDMIKTYKPADLIKLGFDPNEDVDKQVNEYREYARRVGDLKTSLDKKIVITSSGDVARKNDLFTLGSRQVALDQELGKVQNNITSIKSEVGNMAITDPLVDDLNNAKTRVDSQKQALKKAKDEDKHEYQTKLDKYQANFDKLVQDNTEELKTLKKDKNGYYYYENDRKNKHPRVVDLRQEVSYRGELENAIDDAMDEYNHILNGRQDYNKKAEENAEKLKEFVRQNDLKKKEEEAKKKAAATSTAQPTTATQTPTQQPASATTVVQKPLDEQQARHDAILAKIPTGKNINVNLLNRLTDEANKASLAGEISEDHEANLIDILNSKNPVGTPMDTDDEFKDDIEKAKPPVVEEKPEDVKNNGFNPQTNEVQEIAFKENLFSAVAFRSSLKTVTQEEQEKDGVYLGALDEDPYKMFKQGFLRYLILDATARKLYKGLITRDKTDFPRDRGSAAQTELGEVMAITDLKGNILYFDKDFNPSLTKTAGYQELIYSFNKTSWKDIEDLRAVVGSMVTGRDVDDYLEDYQREEEQLVYARNLAAKGINTPVSFAGLSAGMQRQGTKPIDSKIALANQPFKLYIAEALKAYDIKNPDENKYILNIDGQNLINGAAYIQTQRSVNEPAVYTRIIPNAIGENSIIFEDVKALFLNKYKDENEANIVRDYLKQLLFLGFIGRPTVVVNYDQERDIYELNILDNKVTLTKPDAVNYIAEQRLNISKLNINGRFNYYSIKDKKLEVEERQDYNDFILNNSKTRARNIITSQGKVLMNINTYLRFTFDQGVDTLKALAEGKNGEPTSDDEDMDSIVAANQKANEEHLKQLKDLPELIAKAGKVKLSEPDQISMSIDPLGFFTYLYDQAVTQGNLDTMSKPDKYTKEFMDEVLAFFNVKRDNSTLTKEPLQRRTRIQGADEEARKSAEEQKRREDDLFKGDLEAKVTIEENQRLFITDGEISKVNKMFGREVARRIYGIINSDAYGTWMPSGIKLFENAVEGTGYHEAWHEFSQMYLTIAQKKALYDEIRKRSITFKTRDGRKLNSATAIDVDIEEFMADDFRDYILSDGKSRLATAPNRNTIFRKIADFIKRFFFGRINVTKLYEELRTGDLNKYTRSINNIMFKKLNSSLTNDVNEEIFDNKKAAYYRSVFDVLMGEQLLEKNVDIEALRVNKKLTTDIYNNIYNRLLDYIEPLFALRDAGQPYNEDLFNDLYKMTESENWDKMVAYHKKYSKLGANIEFDIVTAVKELFSDEKLDKKEDLLEEEIDDDPESEDFDGMQASTPEEQDTDPENSAEYAAEKSVFADRSGNETSSSDAASLQTKSLIRMLKKVDYIDGKFEVQYDHNGFPRLNDFSHTWNNIAASLADLAEYEDMYAKLIDPQTQIKIPEITELLKHLPHPNDVGDKQQLDRVIAFRTDFNRSQVDIFSGKMNESKDFYFLQETKRNIDQIEKEWSSNFLSIDTEDKLMQDGTVLQSEDGRNYINPDVKLNYDFKDDEQAQEFLDLIGFKMSPETLRNPEIRIRFLSFLEALQGNINERLRYQQKIQNPVYDLKQDLRNDARELLVKGYGAQINAFIARESLYSSINPSMSYQNAEGNTIYALMLNNFMTTTASLINNVKSYDELISKREAQFLNKDNNGYVRHSMFLNKIFNEDGSKNNIKLIVGNYSGLKVVTSKGTKAYSTTSLNLRDKVIMDINSLLKAGAIEIMRTESSKTAYFVKLSSYGQNSYLPAHIEQFSAGFNSPIFISTMKGYLIDEIDRMKTADSITLENYPKEAAKQFNLFRDILRVIDPETGKLSEKLKNKIKEDLKVLSAEEVVNQNVKDIEDAIILFFKGEYKSFMDLLDEEGIDINDVSNDLAKKFTPAQLWRAFIANDFMLNIEYTKIFDGDTIFQAHYKDYHKRAKGAVSTGKNPITDDMFVKYMQESEHNTIAGFLGAAHLNDYVTVKSLVVEEDVRDSIYSTHNIIQENLKRVNPALTDAEIEKIANKYKGMKIGDGQGHITLDFYRQFLYSINNWSDKQELMYQKELAWFRLNNATLNENYSEEQRNRDSKFIERYADIVVSFPPIKMQYNGPIEAVGTYAQVMDKFSVAPLIPSVVQGHPLEKQYLAMARKGIGYSKFESGTKKFKSTPHKVYTENGVDMNLDNYNPPVHFLQFLKEQIHTKSEVEEDKESIFGSQVRKLIMANIFSNGLASDKWLNIKNRYKTIIKSIREFEKEKLYNELGLVEKDNKIVVDNLERFITSIQKQAEFRDLNDNIKDYIQYDKDTKTIKYPLEGSLNKKAIQGMLMGIIDNRLRKQKVSGDMLIQVSSSGFEDNDFKYKAASAEEALKYGTNGLKFYDLYTDKDGNLKTRGVQVKVSINGFKNLLNKIHPDGEKIGDIARLNALLKDENWVEANRDSITMIGYRIPTQGTNSIEYMEVAEFLDERAGNIIIPPAEIVVKSGSDFDIDKMSIFRPAFDRFGNIIDENSITNLEKLLTNFEQAKQIEILKSKYKVKGGIDALADVLAIEDDNDLDADIKILKKEIKKLRNSRKQLYSNQLIKLYSDILSDSSMYEQLITPNDTDLIKPAVVDLAKKLRKEIREAYSGTQIYRYRNNLRKFDSLLSAKKLLGVFAVNNSFSQLLQQGNVGMNMRYNVKKSFKNVKRGVKLLLLSNVEQNAIVIGNRINLSDKYNVHGRLKQDYFSQLINGTVDAASDDFLGYVNISFENVGVINYLLHLGVPFDRVILFINQPVMLKYYSELKRSKQYKNEIQGKIFGDLVGKDFFYDAEGVTKFSSENFNDAINDLLEGSHVDKNKVVKKNIADNFYFSTEKLSSKITRDFNEHLKTDQLYQAAVFAYFVTLQEQSQLFRNYQSVFNMDTTKMQNPMDAFRLMFKQKQILANGLFNEQDIRELERDSIISSFINNKKLVFDIAGQLMPFAFNNYFTAAAADFVEDYVYANKAKISKIMSTLENDWVEYIVKSFGLIEGVQLSSHFKSLLTGPNALAKQLVKLRNKYPELLKEYSIFNKLRSNISTLPHINQQNIEVQKLFEDTSDDQNRYITEFRQLINFQDGNSQREKDVRSFFKKLALLGFLQSGFNRSPVSFQELIPYEEMIELFGSTFKTFAENLTDNIPLLKKFIKNFFSQFITNNPTLISTKKKSKQSWRGKSYNLTNDLQTEIQRELIKKAHLSQIHLLESNNFSKLNPEIDENGNIILKPENIKKLNTGKQKLVSLSEAIPSGEKTVQDSNGNNKSLMNFELLGQYRYDAENYLIYKIVDGKNVGEGHTGDNIAITLGYKSFAELGNDSHMLAFAAGLQTRNIYSVKTLVTNVDNVPVKKETINDEEIPEKVLPSQEKVVSSSMNFSGTERIPVTINYSRALVQKDKNYIYLFTDNAGRTSGVNPVDPNSMYATLYNKNAKYPKMTQALVRGLENAYPITTMVDDQRTQWTDDKFNEYKKIIDTEIDHILGDLQSGEFKGIKFSNQAPFGEGKYSNMKTTAPKIWNYLNEKLLEIGIDNSGAKPTLSGTKSSDQLNRQDAKEVYKEAQNARGLAMQYFISGGKISPETLYNEVLAKRDARLVPTKKQTTEEVKSRDYVKAGAKSIKDISTTIWQDLTEDMQNLITEQDIRDELISIVKDFNKRLDIAKDFINTNKPQEAPIEELPSIEDESPFMSDEELRAKGLTVQSFNDFKNDLDKKDCI